jgi:hypothetical protein
MDSGAEPRRTLQYRYTNVCLLFLLPFIDGIRIGYLYAALPIHYLDMGWPLWSFGVSLCGIFLWRALGMNGIFLVFGHWTVAPLEVLNVCLSIPMAIWWDNHICVSMGLFASVSAFFTDAYQGFVFDMFGDESDRLRASRSVTLSQTIGYAVSPFIGGLLFDAGGWKLSAEFQLVLLSVDLFMLLTNSVVWAKFKLWLQPKVQESKTSQALGGIPAHIRLPSILIALTAGVNIFGYNVEWVTFAVYFRQVFGWESPALAGAAQMSGDIVAAVILVLAAKFKSKASSPSAAVNKTHCCKRLFAHPYMITYLMLAWASLHVLLASPVFAVAVTSQVLMGTVYVFVVQYIVELNTLYSDGNTRVFLLQTSLSSFCYSIFQAMTGLTMPVYEGVGVQVPFYLAAGVAFVFAILYTVLFARRVGLPNPSLQTFEEERDFFKKPMVSCERGREDSLQPQTSLKSKGSFQPQVQAQSSLKSEGSFQPRASRRSEGSFQQRSSRGSGVSFQPQLSQVSRYTPLFWLSSLVSEDALSRITNRHVSELFEMSDPQTAEESIVDTPKAQQQTHDVAVKSSEDQMSDAQISEPSTADTPEAQGHRREISMESSQKHVLKHSAMDDHVILDIVASTLAVLGEESSDSEWEGNVVSKEVNQPKSDGSFIGIAIDDMPKEEASEETFYV